MKEAEEARRGGGKGASQKRVQGDEAEEARRGKGKGASHGECKATRRRKQDKAEAKEPAIESAG